MSDGGKGSGRRPGTGFDPSHARIWPRCNTCRGKGYVMVRHPDPVKVPESSPCPACAEQKAEPNRATINETRHGDRFAK